MTDPLEGEPGTEDDVIDKVKYPRPIIGCKSSERRHAGVDDFLCEEFTEKCSMSVCGINLIFFCSHFLACLQQEGRPSSILTDEDSQLEHATSTETIDQEESVENNHAASEVTPEEYVSSKGVRFTPPEAHKEGL
jgi:hypothetical protein